MSKTLLHLSTLDPERPVIEIDGQKYECVVIEDFGILQHTRFERIIRRVQALKATSENETDDQGEARAQDAEDACRKAIAIIMPTLPADVLTKLRLAHLFAILKAYTDFMQAAEITEKLNPLPKSIGAKSARGSKGSTVAIPANG